MKLDDMVNKNYNVLNENDKLVWRYIYQHKVQCMEMSIEYLAKQCSVSRSTVMRFAQKIGLSGFSELKTHLRWEIQHVQGRYEKLVELICEKNVQAIRHFQTLNYDNICRMMYQAKRIFTYGTGLAQHSVCNEFKRMMLSAGIIVEIIPGEGEFHRSLSLMDEKDLVLIVSKSGESEFIRNITFNLNNRGVTIVSLTNYGNNTLARRSDYNLFVDVEKVDLVDNVNFESMTLFFLILEILFAKFIEYQASHLEESCDDSQKM